MATKKANTEDFSEYKRKFWQLFAYGFLGIILLFLFASWGFFGKMPSFDDLENPDSNVATEIISSDGVGYRDWETDRKSTRLNSSH